MRGVANIDDERTAISCLTKQTCKCLRETYEKVQTIALKFVPELAICTIHKAERHNNIDSRENYPNFTDTAS